ncbi:MAG: FIST C-terminal domain-containing protein [bacterium]|nr:FIST C-terminal domain-containing protein [bacterium]
MILIDPSLNELLSSLKSDRLNFILIGEKSSISIADLIEHANQQNMQIAGGLFPGIIEDRNRYEDGVIIQFLENTLVHTHHQISESKELTYPKLDDSFRSAKMLVDGLTKGIGKFLQDTFAHFGDSIQFIGAGCGSLTLEQKPCLFTNDGFFEDAALIVFENNALNLGVRHGWKKIAGPFVVSKAEGNVIKELNWRPAFEVYKEVLLKEALSEITEDDFFNISKGYPFGISREGTEDIVRDPIASSNQELTCVGEVPEHSTLNILSGRHEDLIQGAKAAAIEASSNEIKSSFVVDCISRVLFQGEKFHRELNIIASEIARFNSEVQVEGVLSLGEISSYGNGYLEFFNKTIVVGTYH